MRLRNSCRANREYRRFLKTFDPPQCRRCLMCQSTIKEELENFRVRFLQNTCTGNDLFCFGSNEECPRFISKEERLETHVVPKAPQVRTVCDDSGERAPKVFRSV